LIPEQKVDQQKRRNQNLGSLATNPHGQGRTKGLNLFQGQLQEIDFVRKSKAFTTEITEITEQG
jgi:hypothetical protein